MAANAGTTKFTVTAGSAAKGTSVKFTGTTQGANPQVTFTDVTSGGTQLFCASATAPGKATVGPKQAGAGIGKITAASTKWNGCTGPLGITLNVTGIGTWLLNAVSYSAGVTTGTITAADAKVATPDGTSCVFTVTGSVPVTYTNSTQILAVSDSAANLVVSNVTGCFGLINANDHASFLANYKIVAKKGAQNPLAITSP
jgi:hypothetical protein